MQTPFKLDIWLQSYEDFVNAKNNIKHKNLNTVFANISKTTSPTSDSFLWIMSHIWKFCFWEIVYVEFLHKSIFDLFSYTFIEYYISILLSTFLVKLFCANCFIRRYIYWQSVVVIVHTWEMSLECWSAWRPSWTG